MYKNENMTTIKYNCMIFSIRHTSNVIRPTSYVISHTSYATA